MSYPPRPARATYEEPEIKADPTAQLRLLDLQAVDTRLTQLKHRRASLPEHQQVAALTREATELGEHQVAARTVVSDLELEQTKAESDLEPVRQRLVRNEQRIADGTVPDPKALSGLIEEVEHLKRRIGDLEDAELDVMQRLEDAQIALTSVTTRQGQVSADLATATTARDAAVAAVDTELATAQAERQQIVAELPADLVQLYDKIRVGHGGQGAAGLVHRRCQGCRLELNAADLNRYAAAAADDVLRCEECSRILVRTEDSGL